MTVVMRGVCSFGLLFAMLGTFRGSGCCRRARASLDRKFVVGGQNSTCSSDVYEVLRLDSLRRPYLRNTLLVSSLYHIGT